MQRIKTKTLLALLMLITILGSCSTQDVAPTGKNRRPLSILYNFEYNGTFKRNGYMLLDLNHDDNKDKKFMVIDVENAPGGGYQFVIKRGPLPIDSLATNWPAKVKSVFYGYNTDMTVDAYMSLRMNSVSNGRINYTYDSTHRMSGTIYMVNYLWNPLYAGRMVGKTPQARAFYWDLDANGNAKPKDIIFYFNESAYTNVISIGHGDQPLTTLVNGIPTVTDDWKKVDAVLTLEGAYYSHFYFDFDAWQYFTTRDFCPSTHGAPCPGGGSVQYSDYRSMDDLMDWPEGWGKP